MKISDIVDRFMAYAGIEDSQRASWMTLCNNCKRILEKMVKKEICDPLDLARLIDACAVLCFYHYTLTVFAREDKSFEAGDIKYTKNERACDYAESLWLDAKKSISDLINDNSFSFVSVPYGR